MCDWVRLALDFVRFVAVLDAAFVRAKVQPREIVLFDFAEMYMPSHPPKPVQWNNTPKDQLSGIAESDRWGHISFTNPADARTTNVALSEQAKTNPPSDPTRLN